MSEPMTSVALAQHLSELCSQVSDAVQRLNDAERDAIHKREDFSQAYAHAFLTATGAVDARKHIATLNTTQQRLDAELAEQTVKALRRQIETLRMRVDVGRSRGAAMRAEASIAGAGGMP